jgi:hypothetical protein
MDKDFFQLHGGNAAEKMVLRKKLRRKEMVAFFKALAPKAVPTSPPCRNGNWKLASRGRRPPA